MAPQEDWDEELDPQYREPDPEAEISDPAENLPDPSEGLGPDVPEVSVPDPTDSEVPQSYAVAFWALVLVVNAALLALWLGLLFVVFEGNADLGGRLLAVGAVLAVYAYYRYRTFPEHPDAGSEDGNDETEDPTASDDGDGGSVAPDDHEDAVDPTPDEGPTPAPEGVVEDDDGRRYVLVKRSGESSLLRDPETGRREYRPNEEVDPVGESPLETAAAGVPEPTRTVLSATHDDRSLGLLLEVVDRGPVAVRSLLADYDLCESDLHGLLAEFRAAGLVEETTVAGERGYEPTDTAREGVASLRGGDR